MTARSHRLAGAIWLAAGLVLAPAGASADPSTPAAPLANTQLRDPAQEALARELMGSLRCLVCQGQSIADSDAAMAGDMRALVRERIRQGDTPAAVRRWLIDRYGDYVTYDPPLGPATWPLWLAPLVLLLVGAAIARSSFGRRR